MDIQVAPPRSVSKWPFIVLLAGIIGVWGAAPWFHVESDVEIVIPAPHYLDAGIEDPGATLFISTEVIFENDRPYPPSCYFCALFQPDMPFSVGRGSFTGWVWFKQIDPSEDWVEDLTTRPYCRKRSLGWECSRLSQPDLQIIAPFEMPSPNFLLIR